MLMTHVFDRIHDEVRVRVRRAGIDQDYAAFAGDEKRFHDAAVGHSNSARHDFHAVDRKVLENAHHRLSLIW
jgi:hypothetical protein